MPTFDVNLPDGRGFEIEAPSLEAAHKAFLQSGLASSKSEDYVPPAPTVAPGVDPGEDVKKLLPSLPGHIAAATFGIPGNLLDTIGLGGVVPTSEDWQKRLQDPSYGGVFGNNYQPQTTQGKYVKSIAENLPSALIPGSLPLRAANVILPGVLGQAGEDAGGPVGRLAGSLIGGFGAGGLAGGIPQAQKVAALKATPSTASTELIKEGGKGFDAFRASKVPIDPTDVENYVNQARNTLATKGLPGSIAGPVHATLDDLLNSAVQAKNAGGVLSTENLSSFRTTLVNAAKSQDGNVRGAAGAAKADFDSWLQRTLPIEAPGFADAVKNTRTGHLLADVESKANKAQLSASAANSGMNTENRLRQVFTTELAKADEAIAHGRAPKWDKDVLGLMRDLVTEGGGNAMRKAGNYLGGGGGALASVYGLAGVATHPALALAPVIGMVIKSAGNTKALAKVDEIAKLITANAPFSAPQAAKLNADITKAMNVVRKSQTTAAKKSAMLQSLQNIRPANVAKAEEDK